jgi:hypothetical protein
MDTLSLFECGSVQMKCASVNRILFSPLSFFKQSARSSADSGLASIHVAGGERNRSQFLQKDTDATVRKIRLVDLGMNNAHTLLRNPLGDINPMLMKR